MVGKVSTDFYLHSERDNTSIYIGYSWGAGVHERTIEDRRVVADWLSDHIGEYVWIGPEPKGEEKR